MEFASSWTSSRFSKEVSPREREIPYMTGSAAVLRSRNGAAGESESESGNVELIEKEHLFSKVVTPSDVDGKLNRLVIPKQHAEKYFPLDAAADEKAVVLGLEDRAGKLWRFRYTYWNSSQSYVMTKGWSRFVEEKCLVAGDTVSFCRGAGEATRYRLFIGWKSHADSGGPHSMPRLPLPMKDPCAGEDWRGRMDDHDLKQMRVTYEFLRQITGEFRTPIGRGSSGVVYKGEGTEGQKLAVKVLDQFPVDFDVILTTSAKVKHPNIMQLLAYCKETKMEHVNYEGNIISVPKIYRALCFEYMHNRSLRWYLYYDDEVHGLGWHERYKIIKGVCEGLKHLHTGFKTPFVHLDLKPDNILLDTNMVPKIADFPLSRLLNERNRRSLIPFGPLDYLAPEYINTGAISQKVDIFSLGVIIIEITVGRMGVSLVEEMGPDSFSEHVCKKWRRRLQLQATPGYTTLDAHCQQVRSCIQIALTCISENMDNRPAIGAIVKELNETEKQISYSTGGTQEVVQTSQELHTETVDEESGNMELNILERIVNESEEPSPLDLSLLQSITENFSDKKKIGSGGCGIVYKGILRNGVVAVKRLHSNRTITSKMFHREVISLISVKHQNIVRFLGYCSFTKEHAIPFEGKTIMADIRERLLCFEYIRNGSLDKHLSDELRGLEWQTRCQIIIGICRGLHYLHKDKEIIHMDLKPGNILLDDLMVPKITDFGLSRLENDSRTRTTRSISRGYTAPEYILGDKGTSKSDIYSLGVIIIELVTGSRTKPNITKVIRRWNHRWIKSMKQPLLGYQQVKKCLELALRCIQDDPKNRPDISDIIDELNEIDTTDGQTQIQMEDILGIEPLEIHVSFEDLKIAHSIQLTNDTDDYIAFVTKAALERFCTEPDKGIVRPQSKRNVTIAMKAHVNAQPNVHYTEVITVLSTRVDNGVHAAMDITMGDIFIDSEEGNVVDEVNVMVVFGTPELPEE